jgi:hypothetical protein
LDKKAEKNFKMAMSGALVLMAVFLGFATKNYFVKKEMIRLRRAIKPIVVKNLDPITKQVISIDRVEVDSKTIFVYLKYNTNSKRVRYSIDIKQSVVKRLKPEVKKWCEENPEYRDRNIEVRFTDDFTKKEF